MVKIANTPSGITSAEKTVNIAGGVVSQ